jgi:hypothetical protein
LGSDWSDFGRIVGNSETIQERDKSTGQVLITRATGKVK